MGRPLGALDVRAASDSSDVSERDDCERLGVAPLWPDGWL